MKLDFTQWKEFNYIDIFDICKGFYNKKPEHVTEGWIPFLGATEKNNGVTEYYSLEDIENGSKTGDDNNAPIEEKIFRGHALCVTNNGSVGFAFYQKDQFTCSHDVNPLYIKNGEFNEYTALFVATVIKHDRYRWAYGRKWRPERMIKSKIYLPADKNGSPDWQYMEKYTKSLKHKHIKTAISSQGMDLEQTTWREFYVGDIMDIYNGKGITQEEIEYNPGDLVAVQSGEENNGCMGKISEKFCKEKGYTFTRKPCLTVARSGSAGYISFQANGCVVGDSAKILLLKDVEHANKYVYLFLKTILMANKYKYTYGRKVTEDKYKQEVLFLPANNEKPNYSFMEEYIKKLPFSDKV